MYEEQAPVCILNIVIVFIIIIIIIFFRLVISNSLSYNDVCWSVCQKPRPLPYMVHHFLISCKKIPEMMDSDGDYP